MAMHVATSSGTLAGSTVWTVTAVTGVTAGDLLVVAFHSSSSPGTITPPTGWTRQLSKLPTGDQGVIQVWKKVATASEPASYTFTNTGSVQGRYVVTAQRNVLTDFLSAQSADIAANSDMVLPAATTSNPNFTVLWFAFGRTSGNAGGVTYVTPTGLTQRAQVTASDLLVYGITLYEQVVPTASTIPAVTLVETGAATNAEFDSASVMLVLPTNNAPNAPTPTYPVSNVSLDRNVTQRFSWTFSDPDAGDTQSKYDIRYRPVGVTTWTGPFTGTTAFAFHDSGAGTFTDGQWEWQVRTYDSVGSPSPFSASGFFTAATVPAGPTITAPTNGSTLSSAAATLVWSSPTQDAYQVRKVADNAGVADTATTYFDTGTVESSIVRSHALTFPANTRYEHLQVRVRTTGLWSAWASTRVLVSYTPPTTPSLTVIPVAATGSIDVTLASSVNRVNAESSSFEGGTNGGWSNATNSAVRAFSGTKSVTLTNGATAITTDTDLSFVFLGATPAGLTQTYSVYVFSTATCTLGVWRSGDAGVNASYGPVVAVAANTWTRLTLTYTTVVAQNDFLRVYARTLAANQVVFVDAAQVEQGSSATTYMNVTMGATPVTADLWRRENYSLGDGIRVATGLLPASTHVDRTVASDRVYEYRSVSFASNGASATSAWNPGIGDQGAALAVLLDFYAGY